MAKKALFKGLSAIFATLVPITTFMSVLAFARQGDIDLALGVKAETAQGDGNSTYFPSAYSSVEEMRKAEKDYQIRTMEEGSVLLHNKDKALPLSKYKVTLFGNASVNPAYHGGSGGPTNTGVDLKKALEEEGFEINEAVYEKIKAQKASRTNSDIAEVDASIYQTSDLGEYKDAAIVTICRYGGENNDMDLEDKYGVPELSLHESEKDMLSFVRSAGFEKIIVLLNTGYAMDMGWFDEYGVDAALWISYPGAYGFHGVAKLLKGEASPSGRLVDTYATSALSSPAMANFGDFRFEDLPTSLFHCEYLVYAENIYVGYKYYETRYEDQVRGIHNASSAKGAFMDANWDYAKEVAYPFGYGLSYASFSESLESLSWDHSSNTVTASVKVKNLDGSVSAKHAVELYASLPYEEGNAEKSAIQLIGFGKTKELAPGEEETITIEVDDYLFATYDEKATNGADPTKKGCYVFDPGDYYFAVGLDAHDALNNVLAKKGVTGLFDQNGSPVYGNAGNVRVENLASLDNLSHAKSATGEVVYNRFQDIDYNHFVPGTITYLTRNNWDTFPQAIVGLKADDDTSGKIRRHMTATSSLYEKPSDAPDVKSFTYGAEVTKKFIEMKNVPFEDEQAWNAFIDQLDVQSLALFVGEKMGNDAIVNIGYPKNTSGDGPDGLQGGGILHPSENLAASTYNLELLKERGRFLAEDAYYNGFGMVYGGGCNLHRTPYAGRNFEYYSEDSNIAYYCGRTQGKAMSEKGLIGAFKHFLGNDQETNRHGVATFMSEQTLRENQARAFEGALTDGAALGNMGAYNRIGIYPTSCHKPLMTDLLRKEWGFKGISITDSSKDAGSYLFTAEAIDAGTTCFNNDADRSTEARALIARSKDGNIWRSLRQQAKYFFYAYSRSKVTNGLTLETVVTSQTSWWKYAVNALEATLLGLLALSVGGYIVFAIKGAKRKER